MNFASPDGSEEKMAMLSPRHFEVVARSSQVFSDYLTSTFGGRNDADIAKVEQLRRDDFDPKFPVQTRPRLGPKSRVPLSDSEEDS